MHTPDSNDVAHDEPAPVSTGFDARTGDRVKRGAVIAAIVVVIAFALVGLVRFFDSRTLSKGAEESSAAALPVDVITAHKPKEGEELMLPGQTAAWYETVVYARVNGYVARWLVDIGDRVKAGQVLADIETPELDAELTAARAQLKASRAQVEARRSEAAFAKSTDARWRDSPKGVVSEQERESKKADAQSAAARLYAAEAQVALDEARVQQYGALAEFKQVKSPLDGTVTERKIDVGNLVTAGSGSTTTSLYRISQMDPLRIFVDVPQSAAGDLMQPGVPAQISARGAIGGGYEGKTARAAGAMDPQARTMRVEVDMPNSAHALVPGMYVNVGFQLKARGSVEVPAAALIFRAGMTQVAVVDAGSHVQFRNVVIARDNGGSVELASGVNPGDRLVLNISSQVKPGQAVAAREADATHAPAPPTAKN
jgi:RND family efflux transporter MFP subunit